MNKLPFLGVVLMLAGVVPYIVCTCGIVFYDSHTPVPNLLTALVVYGAISLSFIGAVHWGQALETDRTILVASAGRTDHMRLLLGGVASTGGLGRGVHRAYLAPLGRYCPVGCGFSTCRTCRACSMAARLGAAGVYGCALDCDCNYRMLSAYGVVGSLFVKDRQGGGALMCAPFVL